MKAIIKSSNENNIVAIPAEHLSSQYPTTATFDKIPSDKVDKEVLIRLTNEGKVDHWTEFSWGLSITVPTSAIEWED